jgi:hypothetical protein
MKRSPLFSQSFPALSPNMSSIIQQLLADLERECIDDKQTRILVTIEARQNPAVFLTCMEHLLRFTKETRLLILTSASAKPALVSAWQTALSAGAITSHFPPCSPLTLPLAPQTRVCLTTIRELQRQQIEQAHRLSELFAMVIVYDLPAHLSPVWKRVIEKLQTPSLIAFCANHRLNSADDGCPFSCAHA